MTAKEYLLQAKSLKIRIGTMHEQLEYLRSAALYDPPQYSNMPRSSTRNIHKNEDAIIRVMDKEEQIKATQAKLGEVVATIDRIENPVHQAILVKRYISEKLWSEISAEIYISVTRLYELHRDALAEVEAILKERSKP